MFVLISNRALNRWEKARGRCIYILTTLINLQNPSTIIGLWSHHTIQWKIKNSSSGVCDAKTLKATPMPIVFWLVPHSATGRTASIGSKTQPCGWSFKWLRWAGIKLHFIWNMPRPITADLSRWIECQRKLEQSRHALNIQNSIHYFSRNR